MPSVSQAQRRAMGAAKAGHSTLGIPKSVGKEFIAADPGGKLPPRAGSPKTRNDHMAARKEQGLTNQAIGKEFNRHRTTVGRALRQGFVKVGNAHD